MTEKSALKRFAASLPTKPHCSEDLKYGLSIRSRELALRYPLIQLNTKLRFYLPFDIDRGGAAFAYEDARLPAPTMIMINKLNAHAHMLYELEHPVLFPDQYGKGTARPKPVRFYQAVLNGMAIALGADRGYAGYMCKNPFHSEWELICHNSAVYTLEDLCDYVDPIYPSRSYRLNQLEFDPTEIIYEGRRHQALFDLARTFAYSQVRICESLEGLLAEIHDYCSVINTAQMRPPLTSREVASISKSVAKWVWIRRANFSDKNRGVMGFEGMPWFPNKQEFIDEMRRRQAEGANFTNRQRRAETESKIIDAIRELQEENKKVTQAEVARRIGMDRTHISKHYSHLFSADDRSVDFSKSVASGV